MNAQTPEFRPAGGSQGLIPGLALEEVVRQLPVVLLQPILVQLLDGLPNGPVQGPTSLHQEAIVGDILDHGVLKDVGRLRQEPLLVDDLQGLQLAQQPFESIGLPGHTRQEPHQELPTDHRGQLHGPLAFLPEAVQAGHNDALDGLRDAHLTERLSGNLTCQYT